MLLRTVLIAKSIFFFRDIATRATHLPILPAMGMRNMLMNILLMGTDSDSARPSVVLMR